MDMDVFAAMGISGFGKAVNKKHEHTMERYDRDKRAEDNVPAKEKENAKEPGPSQVSTEKPTRYVGPTRPPRPPPAPEAEPEYDPDDDDIGPKPLMPPSAGVDDDEEEDDDDDGQDEEPEYDPDEPTIQGSFPISHELILSDHTKVISALALDPSGARFVSGSHDYDCKLWDFGGMASQPKPFKTWEPAGTYYVNDLKFSLDGTKFLCISGTTQAKLFDRDGEEVSTFIKGDPYIRDMKHTAGHVSELSCGSWHPKDPQIFMTASADSTIRLWDVENKRKQKTVIVVKSKERGTRTKVTACSYTHDGNYISAACLDGALHVWKTNSNFVRPDMTIEGAHGKGTGPGSVVFSVDNRTVLTRGGDDTVKLWDLRAFKKPLLSKNGITTLYPGTNAIFSPDEKFIVTGQGAGVKGGSGKLLFMRREDLEVTQAVETSATPVKVLWHSKINQILTGLANGRIHVLYSPLTSLNGAKLLIAKGPPRKATIESMSAAELTPAILTPNFGSMYGDNDEIKLTKRKRDRERMDPRKSRRPELPISGPGKGGRVGASATQHVVQNLFRDTTRDQDPREALLRYAEVADKDPLWTAAWKQNQPKPVFAEAEQEEEEEE